MKNFTLLFVLLLPFFGFSQVELVKWNSSDFTPSTTADFVTGYAIDAPNVSLQANNYGINDTFFHISGWPSNNTASETRYIQFRANSDNGFKIKATSFNFKAKTTSAPMKLKVIAAKNANFNNPIEILSETNVTGSYVNYTASFPANYSSNTNGNIFIRIYVYGTNNSLLINYDNSLTTGPVLKGSLTTEEVYAVNDIVNIDKNTSSSINVLANDYPGTGSFTSVSNLTTPTNAAGTVTVNANNTIQFVPATGFTGSSTFNYKVTNSTGSSAIATVTVNVSEPALAEWNLSSNSNVTFQQSYVSATNLSFTQFGANYSSLGMAISHTEDPSFQHYRAFDLKIKPTAGSVLNITNLVFEQERLAANSAIGASNYQIKYKIVTGNFNETTYSFFNTATVLINDESVASNPIKNIPFNVSVNENQTLVVRFYARGGNDYNFNGWRIKTNTLKLRGTATTPCVPPANTQEFGINEWNGYIYTYADNNTIPNFNSATFIGTLKENDSFERNVGAGTVNGRETSLNIPSCIAAPSNLFMVRYKMKLAITDPGIYNFTISGDDAYRLTVDNDLIIDSWSDNSSTVANLKNLSVGNHELILEYYEKYGNSSIQFTYGKIKIPGSQAITLPFGVNETNLPFGINEWKVYGFSTQSQPNDVFTLDQKSYAGYYTQTDMAPNTESVWNKNNAPSTITIPNVWNGAPTHRDNFTISYRRQGFKCGTYILKMENWDDAVAIYLNDNPVAAWKANNYSGGVVDAAKIVATLNLNASSKIEIKLKDRGSAGYFNMSITEAPVVYTGQSISDSANTSIKIDSDIQITTKLDVCSCTVADGKKLTIKPDAILNVTENITVIGEGKIIVENNGSLVQINDDATYTGNNKSFLLNRTTTPVSRFDYTYWSSPLKTTSDFLVGRDQTNSNRKGLSPTTYFDKYYSFNGGTQAWSVIQYGTEVMVPAKGYIVRAPQEFAITNNPSATFTAKFEGVPNNGIITLPLVIGTNGKSNLIGNPYPSAIDAYKFIDENAGLMDGTFYFWTHNIALSSTPDANGILQYNPASYISLNKTGSTSNGKNSPKASRNIAAGQGFFINSTNAGAITFNNSMRVTNKDSNSSFFRMANTTQSSEETNEEIDEAEETTVEANRVWLNISNAAGAYNETLIGYVSGATNNLEDAYDGITYASGTAIYTLQSNKKLVIQGRALPFVNTDVVPLGFMAATAGEYTIAIESFDGLFEDQKVFLVDRTDNSIHNLKNESYTFTSQAGTFDSRFEIRYVNDSTLGTDNPIITQNDVVVFKSANQISVRANNLTIDNVQVYDITGKLITSAKNINDSTFTTSGLNVATQVLIVKVTLDDNQTISKKVIMN